MYRFYRGLNGDKTATGTSKTVNVVTDSRNTRTFPDTYYLKSLPLEHQQMNSVAGFEYF